LSDFISSKAKLIQNIDIGDPKIDLNKTNLLQNYHCFQLNQHLRFVKVNFS